MVKAIHGWRHKKGYGLGCSHGAKGSNKAANRGIAYHNKIFRKLEASPPADLTPLIEPWLQEIGTGKFCQPDAILFDHDENAAIVVEVKMNWKDGRDEKLLDLYLPAVKSAFALDMVWPLLVTSNLRGWPHPPLLGLGAAVDAMAWELGAHTPVLLQP